MKKKYIRYIYTLLRCSLFGVAVSGCSDSLDFPDHAADKILLPGEYRFVISAGDDSYSSPSTRVTYTSLKSSTFDTGDAIGVFCPDKENSKQIQNDIFSAKTLDGEDVQVLAPPSGNITQELETEIPDSQPHYLFYYPLDPNYTLSKITSGTGFDYSVETDQSTKENFQKSDFLWSYHTTTDTEVQTIHMHHLMAQIIVKVPTKDVDEEVGVTLKNIRTKAHNVHFLTQIPGSMDDGSNGASSLTTATSDIKMYQWGTDGDYTIYRAAIPAWYTIDAKTPIVSLRAKNNQGNYENLTYRLGVAVTLKDGYYYTFTLSTDQAPIIPDVTDDDSWVYEIRDPKDNELVGYLCREYLYYEPEGLSDYRNSEFNTSQDPSGSKQFQGGASTFGLRDEKIASTCPGTQVFFDQLTNPDIQLSNIKKSINSQVWVFYNLDELSGLPNLTEGTVLRFIYDVKASGNLTGITPHLIPSQSYISSGFKHTTTIWPSPHSMDYQEDAQGLFKSLHGHDINSTCEDTKYGKTIGYSYDSKDNVEMYMHGGKVFWDPTNGIISDFVLPDIQISNQIAMSYGHIAIKEENNSKTVFVSFDELQHNSDIDSKGNRVAYRIEKTITVGDETYPLRKVGFNQFWTAKSLSSTKDKNNNELECFNTTGELGEVTFRTPSNKEKSVKYGDEVVLPAGYVYPFAKVGRVFTSQMDGENVLETDYDPFNIPSQRQNVVLLYDNTAIMENKLVPAGSSGENWRIPTWKDMVQLRRYGGCLFAAKWISDDMRTRIPNGKFLEKPVEALVKGLNMGSKSYCSNISGLDFKCNGAIVNDQQISYLENELSIMGICETTCFYVNSNVDNTVSIYANSQIKSKYDVTLFNFNIWDCWGSNPMPSNYHKCYQSNSSDVEQIEIDMSRCFAPVRLVMSFDNAATPSGKAINKIISKAFNKSVSNLIPRGNNRKVEVPLIEVVSKQ